MRATALVHGLKVLDVIAGTRGETAFGRIRACVGASTPTLSAILSIFTENGYVRKTSGGYELGTRFLPLAAQVLERFEVRDEARDELRALRDLSGETAELSVPEPGGVLFVDRWESPQEIRLHAQVGFRTPLLHGLAVGKIHLAFHMDESQRRRYYRELAAATALHPNDGPYDPFELRAALRDWRESEQPLPVDDGRSIRLPALTEHTMRSSEEVESACARALAERSAWDREEARCGVSRAAAPVLDHRGRLAAIVSVVCLAFRTSDEQLESLRHEVRAAGERVSRRIGWDGETGRGV